MIKHVLYIASLCLLMLLVQGCESDLARDKWVINLSKDSKKPYGTYLAHSSLKMFFPAAEIKDLSRSYRFSSIDDGMKYNATGVSMMVLTGMNFNLSEKEWSQLQVFVREGNELVIFASHFDDKILHSLGVAKVGGTEQQIIYSVADLAANKQVLTLPGAPFKKYGYTGRSIDGYFGKSNVFSPVESASDYEETTTTAPPATDTVMAEVPDSAAIASLLDTATNDTTIIMRGEESSDDYEYEQDFYTIADTISYANGKPDCLRIVMGRGHITIHAAPLVMSNYFLLQDGNIDYLTRIWQAMPLEVNRIYWDDFMTHSSQETKSNALWNYPATRWALLLSFFIAAVYILFQMKRRQRIVPVIAPLRNDSVSFVETVGRLYYNKGNNANLAEKMVQQYLEWVRTNCYLNTSLLNEEFVQQLAMKSGQPIALVSELVNMIHEVRIGHHKIDDPYLYHLYNTIQQFYKNHHK